MVQILPEVPSFGTQFARGLGAGLSQGLGKSADFAMKMNLQQAKQKEKETNALAEAMQTASSSIDTLENLINKPGIGLLSQLNPSAEARRNRGLFQSTTSGIIPIFKSLFPRGMTQTEFKYITDTYIPQSHDTEATIRGKIEGLKNILNKKMKNPDLSFKEVTGIKEKKEPETLENKTKKEKFNASNPEHKAKANQLFKTHKNKEKVREILKREFEGL